MAKGKLPKENQKKVEEWKFLSGAVMMYLVAYSDRNDVQTFQFVNCFLPMIYILTYYSVKSSPNVGNSFTNSCQAWKYRMYENFKEWAVKQFRMNGLESNDEAEAPPDMLKSKDIHFKKNNWGHFILPPIENYHNVKQRKRVVRGYIGVVYH